MNDDDTRRVGMACTVPALVFSVCSVENYSQKKTNPNRELNILFVYS